MSIQPTQSTIRWLANEAVAGIKWLAGEAVAGTKELLWASPGVIADVAGDALGGKVYHWGARPIGVGAHSLFWKKTDKANAAFNAFWRPVGQAIVEFGPVHYAIEKVSDLADKVTGKIPNKLFSERFVKTTKQHTKNQFLRYLEIALIYKVASRFFKVEQPEPSFTQVIHPINLVWVGLSLGIMDLIKWLTDESEEEEVAKVEVTTPKVQEPQAKRSQRISTRVTA